MQSSRSVMEGHVKAISWNLMLYQSDCRASSSTLKLDHSFLGSYTLRQRARPLHYSLEHTWWYYTNTPGGHFENWWSDHVKLSGSGFRSFFFNTGDLYCVSPGGTLLVLHFTKVLLWDVFSLRYSCLCIQGEVAVSKIMLRYWVLFDPYYKYCSCQSLYSQFQFMECIQILQSIFVKTLLQHFMVAKACTHYRIPFYVHRQNLRRIINIKFHSWILSNMISVYPETHKSI